MRTTYTAAACETHCFGACCPRLEKVARLSTNDSIRVYRNEPVALTFTQRNTTDPSGNCQECAMLVLLLSMLVTHRSREMKTTQPKATVLSTIDATKWGGVFAGLAISLSFCFPVGAQSTPSPQQAACVDEPAASDLIAGNFKRAADHLRRAIAANPKCPDLHYQYAYALLRQNLAKDSLAEYTSAAHLRSPSPVDLRNAALDYALLEDYTDAEYWTRRSLALNDKDAESWYVLGRIQYTAGRWPDALNSFQRARELAPDSAKTENNLGLTYESLNQVDKATEAYRRAIALDEQSNNQSEQPLINLAVLLSHKGNLDEALSLLLKAVQIAPVNADVREHLGQLYLERNQLPEAQGQLEKAVSLQPKNARLHFLLGQAYRRAGMTDKAKSELALSASLLGSHSTPDYFE